MNNPESRLFQDEISQKFNDIANIPSVLNDFIFGAKTGPTPAEEFASFLHLCQVGLIVGCILGLVACIVMAGRLVAM